MWLKTYQARLKLYTCQQFEGLGTCQPRVKEMDSHSECHWFNLQSALGADFTLFTSISVQTLGLWRLTGSDHSLENNISLTIILLDKHKPLNKCSHLRHAFFHCARQTEARNVSRTIPGGICWCTSFNYNPL